MFFKKGRNFLEKHPMLYKKGPFPFDLREVSKLNIEYVC